GHAFDAREREHAAPTLRKLRDRALQEIDLGAILDHARGVRRLIRNLEQAVHLVGGQTALLRATAVARDVERDAKQVRLRAANRSDLAQSFKTKIGLVESFRSEVRRTQTTRQSPVEIDV